MTEEEYQRKQEERKGQRADKESCENREVKAQWRQKRQHEVR